MLALEQFENTIAMMREIGVYADPLAIAAPIDASDFVPEFVARNIVDAKVAFTAEFCCSMTHVDANLIR